MYFAGWICSVAEVPEVPSAPCGYGDYAFGVGIHQAATELDLNRVSVRRVAIQGLYVDHEDREALVRFVQTSSPQSTLGHCLEPFQVRNA